MELECLFSFTTRNCCSNILVGTLFFVIDKYPTDNLFSVEMKVMFRDSIDSAGAGKDEVYAAAEEVELFHFKAEKL